MKAVIVTLLSLLLFLVVIAYPAYYFYQLRLTKLGEVQSFIDESGGIFQVKKIQWNKRYRWHFEIEGVDGKRMVAFVVPLTPEDPPVPGQWWRGQRSGVWLFLTEKTNAPAKGAL